MKCLTTYILYAKIRQNLHNKQVERRRNIVNKDKLKGKLVEKKKTYEDCATVLCVSITTFSNKLNGRGSLYIEEVNALSDYLGLTDSEKN